MTRAAAPETRPTLIIFAGLSGVGKTTIARELARQVGAVYVRIDSIEQALRDAEVVAEPLNDAGYRAAYAVAEDNLRLGRTVIADSVNPLRVTRDAWLNVARRAHANAVEVEIICSDAAQHRSRIETRTGDIPGLRLPTWQEAVSRNYQPWDRQHIIIDTASGNMPEVVQRLKQAPPTVLPQ